MASLTVTMWTVISGGLTNFCYKITGGSLYYYTSYSAVGDPPIETTGSYFAYTNTATSSSFVLYYRNAAFGVYIPVLIVIGKNQGDSFTIIYSTNSGYLWSTGQPSIPSGSSTGTPPDNALTVKLDVRTSNIVAISTIPNGVKSMTWTSNGVTTNYTSSNTPATNMVTDRTSIQITSTNPSVNVTYTNTAPPTTSGGITYNPGN